MVKGPTGCASRALSNTWLEALTAADHGSLQRDMTASDLVGRYLLDANARAADGPLTRRAYRASAT